MALKQKIKQGTQQVTNEILKSLYSTFLADQPPHPFSGYNYFGTYYPPAKVSGEYYLKNSSNHSDHLDRDACRATISRLKKQGWIVEAEKSGKKFLKLTKKGKVKTLLYKLQNLGGQKQKRKLWDGKWRIAIFDIPEHTGRAQRYQIRRALCFAGFCYLQKSVYVYPYELPAELVSFLKESGLFSFIRFLRVDKMDDQSDLKKKFKL